MESFLDEFFERTLVLWRKKDDQTYVCVSDSYTILEDCMAELLKKEEGNNNSKADSFPKIRKLILVKDMLKQTSSSNSENTYFSVLVDALKRYKVDQILDPDDSEYESQIQDFVKTKQIKRSKLYITVSSV